MSKVEKYLKLAKNIVITPKKEDIDEKIINRIENLSEDDKKLLDERFMDYMRKNNSRLYLFSEDLKNKPGKLAVFALLFLAIFGIIIFVYRLLFSSSSKEQE
jgi:hypothetical protein